MATHNLSPTQSAIKKTVLVAETLVAACLLLAISAIIFAVWAEEARSIRKAVSQLIDCRPVPPSEDGTEGRWIYRFVEGRTCWFEANGLRRGREKPLEELRWKEGNLRESSEGNLNPDCSAWRYHDRWSGQ